MEYYRFREDTGIHEIDYSGKIDLAEGLLRMKQLEKRLNECVSGCTALKVLFDVRNTVWEDARTHDILAKTARQIFDIEASHVRRHVAVVNKQYNGSAFGNERWFTSKQEALDWLTTQCK